MNTSIRTENGKKLIAYYGRVSTSLQEDQKTIENQWMELEKLAAELYGEDGYIVVRKYSDEAWSGDILARPNLDQLRQDATADMWDAVLMYDPDRLARRFQYQELVLDELREAGKDIHFRTIKTPDNPEDQILFGFRGLFAQYERIKIAERFRIGKLRKARDKHIITSIAPYGYTLIQRKGKPNDPDFVQTHLVINPEEAVIVRKIFYWIGNEGLTLRKVIRRLQQQGIKPRKNKEGVWGTTTLSTMLKRETYIGKAYYGASTAIVPKKPWKKDKKYRKVKKTSRIMKPKKEWIEIPAPAILEGEEGKALFSRAQRQLTKNFEDCKRNKKNNYLLAERIRCECGCSRTGEGPQNGKYLYYRCSSRVKSYPLKSLCNEKGINARIADEKVWSKLVQLMSSKQLILEQLEDWKSRQKIHTNTSGVDIEMLRKEIMALKKQEQRYQLAYGEGAIQLSHLSELTAPLREKISGLERRIREEKTTTKERIDNSILLPEEVGKLNVEALEVLQGLNFEQKRDIILDIVSEIKGVPGQLKVSGFVPVGLASPYQYDILVLHHIKSSRSPNYYVEFKTSDRNCGSTKCGEVHAF